jgi:hypothetical protein
MDVRADEALGKGRKRAEREGKWKALKKSSERDRGWIAV